VLSFRVDFRSGESLHRQVVYAVKKAIASGRLVPGDLFPSVRVLAQELRINPNTAHRIVATLTDEGFLEVVQGVGTRIMKVAPPSGDERTELLGQEVERLVVEAKSLSLRLEDLLEAVRRQWDGLRKEPK
jgi:GntR family transcriptional regulator